MRWNMSRFTTSLAGLLRYQATESQLNNRVEDVRDAMLDCMLTVLGKEASPPILWNRILLSHDAQSLWYLRSDLMAFLSEHRGETVARKSMMSITDQFKGLVSTGQFEQAKRFQKR